MVRLMLYPLFSDLEDRLSPLEALDQLTGPMRFAVRQADKKTKHTTTDRSSSCLCLRGAAQPGSPRKRAQSLAEEDTRSDSPDDSKFVLNCNVRGYKPEEISVKAVDDCIEVSAKHEEESEDGSSYVKREFTRRFTLPEGVKAETVTCGLLSSGMLAIEAPKPEPPRKKPRTIPIVVESSKPIAAVADQTNKATEKPEEGSTEAAQAS
ncbi:heat shock protein beta-1-like [Dermacentor variabilis]|uniref:heat shock protein beta-1-like n=1 Tax=Dermacentor variabilis TaxID=34621 RepID=UPI003F5B173F